MIESKTKSPPIEIALVDRGRGLQLSTSRITVMDLVQYLRRGWSYEEIGEIIPSLTRAELAVVEEYYRAHKEELEAEDDRVVAYREEQLRVQREHFPMPDETREERMARFRRLLKKHQETNGQGNLG